MISFITLAAYDWTMLPTSISAYYNQADEILVGLDQNRRTWSGTSFDLPYSELWETLNQIDPDHKIQIIEGDFYNPSRTPLHNDTSEREVLASVTKGDWIVEVDADEIIDAKGLLEELPQAVGRQVCIRWQNIYKVIGDTALMVDTDLHFGPVATKSRNRRQSRRTREPIYLSNTRMEHLTCGRPQAALEAKLSGWGHSTETRPSFLSQWENTTLANYSSVRDFHQFIPGLWPSLKAVPVSALKWSDYLKGNNNGR